MDSERRADTLAVLLQLIPPTFDVLLLGGCRTVPSIYFGRTDGGRTQHFTALPAQLSATEAGQRKAIYKCIRRHVTKLLAGCPRVATLPLDDAANINHSDEAMYPSIKICPRSQALALWRLHFETLNSDKRSLTLRQAALNWPWGATADRAAWAGYVLASFHAAVAAFDAWRLRAESLPDDSVLGGGRPKARELFTEFSPLLSPAKLPTFPAISALKFGDSAPGWNLAVVGPARNGINSQLGCGPGPWCSCKSRQQCRDVAARSSRPPPLPRTREPQIPRVMDDYVATEYIRPLDELNLPISLDGSVFQIERKRRGCTIEATNDIEAIEYWLDQCTKRMSTRRMYRLCAEKCLIWAVAQRRKPLSALDQSDAAAYVDFLVDPRPKEIWLVNGGALRNKPSWSPFKKPLAAKSRDYSVTVLALLFKYWHGFAYVESNPWTHLPFAFAGAARLEQAPLTAVKRDTNFVTLPEWRYVFDASKQSRNPGDTDAMQTILFLTYYAALKPHEIAELRLEDVRYEELEPRSGKVWSLTVRSRHLERQRVFLFPFVAERLARYFPTSIRGFELLRKRDAQVPLIDLIGSPFSAAGRGVEQENDARQYLYLPSKEVFKEAADLARRAGAEIESARLARASITWLAGSLEVHVRQMELSEYALWHVLGAQRLIAPSMRRYLPADREHLDRPLKESMDALRPLFPP